MQVPELAQVAEPAPSIDGEEDVADLSHRQANHRWGPFGITTRRDSRCWVARCPFHKKNDTTDCKKQSSAKDGTAEALQNALLQLYAPALAAKGLQR